MSGEDGLSTWSLGQKTQLQPLPGFCVHLWVTSVKVKQKKVPTHILQYVTRPICQRVPLRSGFGDRDPIHLSRADGIGYRLLAEADRTRVEGGSRRKRFETRETETRNPGVTGRAIRHRDHAQGSDSGIGAARCDPLISVGMKKLSKVRLGEVITH
jgi:hypothetical protein